MGAVDTTYTFTATDTITSAKMNNIIDQTTITTGAIIGTTLEVASGQLKIRSAGITSNEMAANSVVTAAITDANVTTAKIADGAVTSAKLASTLSIGSLSATSLASSGTVVAGNGITSGDASVLIGYNRTSSGTASIYFYSDAGTTLDAYIRREAGTNQDLKINNVGTGDFTNTGSNRYGYNTASPTNAHHFVGGIRNTSPNSAGTGTTLVIDGNGDIKAFSSSIRHKNSIEDYYKGLKDIKQLRPVTYKFNGEDIVTAGFIAEEVDAIGMDEYVIKNSEGQPDALGYAQMVALLVNGIKELSAKVEELEEKVHELQGK
jgi:hypothetical protein